MITAIIGHDHYKTELHSGTHEWIADEAEEAGGTDLGPSPGQLLMMSLASCTAITLRMYADRKKMPLDQVRVEVDLQKKEAGTMFTRHIYLSGGLDEDQRHRLLQIANACPIHKTLTNPIEIKTEIK